MPRILYFLALALLAFVTDPQANAAPQVSIAPTFPISMYSTPIKNCGGFAQDELTLTVSDHGKQIAQNIFCSSYGRASARAVTDTSGRTFIILEYSENRGTNATTAYLQLDRLNPDLQEVLRLPLSWATSPTQRFTYSYAIELPTSGGINIHLTGQVLGHPFSNPKFDCCIPAERDLTIDVGR